MEHKWTLQDSVDYYLIDKWGEPYFALNGQGNLVYQPRGAGAGEIALKALVDDLRRRGIQAPVLVRFNDILASRIAHLNQAFKTSIDSYGYQGSYRSVMPIKVNQQRHVVEELVRVGAPHRLGLEAGSKPELLVAIALLQGDGALLICNGYKDAEYIETALNAQWLGLCPYLVLDRFAELDLIIEVAERTGIRPHIGMRAKLSTRGSGRWKESTGDRSKFGLSAREMVLAVEKLQAHGMLDCLQLLHFHIGSQITAIKSVKEALREAMQLYCNLRQLGATDLTIVDCGGGLAVDYDGSRTNFHSSMNYSTQEYANDVVSILQDISDAHGVPHPTILTESGRALVAQHSVLIFNVLGVHELAGQTGREEDLTPAHDAHEVLQRMWEAYNSVNKRNFQEAYNDIIELKEESITLFRHGLLNLQTRARAEELFWATCRRIQKTLRQAEYVPDDLSRLDKELSDTYYCNFSVFQSLPDSWAVGHLFPITPIHRLNEEPTRDAILADLTCDSDGKLDRFIDLRDVRDTLRLHEPNGKPYYLGAFLVGAYQEILGDLHNLFGDTNAVHVTLDADGNYNLEHLVEGDTVSDVLGYVEYDRNELLRRVRASAEAAVRSGRFASEHFAQFMRRYEEGLNGYTYLEDID
jgi:arginine decarboxylase